MLFHHLHTSAAISQQRTCVTVLSGYQGRCGLSSSLDNLPKHTQMGLAQVAAQRGEPGDGIADEAADMRILTCDETQMLLAGMHGGHPEAVGVPVTSMRQEIGHSDPTMTIDMYPHALPGQE